MGKDDAPPPTAGALAPPSRTGPSTGRTVLYTLAAILPVMVAMCIAAYTLGTHRGRMDVAGRVHPEAAAAAPAMARKTVRSPPPAAPIDTSDTPHAASSVPTHNSPAVASSTARKSGPSKPKSKSKPNPKSKSKSKSKSKGKGKGKGKKAAVREDMPLTREQVDAMYEEGRAMVVGGRAGEAVGLLERIVAQQPLHKFAWTTLGVAYYHTDELDEAVRCYEEALRIDPMHTTAHNNLAAVFEARGELVEALEHLRPVLEAAPDNDAVVLSVASLLLKTGGEREAVPLLRALVERVPDDVEARARYGRALLLAGKLRAARKQLERVLRAEPQRAAAQIDLGSAWEQLGDTLRALHAYAAAGQMLPVVRGEVTAHGFLHATRGAQVASGTSSPLGEDEVVPADVNSGWLNVWRVLSAVEEGELERPVLHNDGAAALLGVPGKTLVGLAWKTNQFTGWGNFGINYLRELRSDAQHHGVLLDTPVPHAVSPAHAEASLMLRASMETLVLVRATVGLGLLAEPRLAIPVLHPLAYTLEPYAVTHDMFRGAPSIGMVFLEVLEFTADAVESAREFDILVTGSHYNTHILTQLGLPNVRTVWQGVNTRLFTPRDPTRAPRTRVHATQWEGRVVVFSGGKLELRKGQDQVVAAFRRFLKLEPTALLVTAWQNFFPATMASVEESAHVRGLPERNDEEAWIDVCAWLEDNGIPRDACVNLGRLDHASFARALEDVDMCVFPNRCEGGTNLVAMECAARGVPTVLSFNSGHVDLAEHLRDGVTALRRQIPCALPSCERDWRDTDIDELVDAMVAIAGDPHGAASRAQRAAQRMASTMSWRTSVDAFLALLGGGASATSHE